MAAMAALLAGDPRWRAAFRPAAFEPRDLSRLGSLRAAGGVRSVMGIQAVPDATRRFNIPIEWPGLHNTILRMAPAVSRPAPYAAIYNFTWLSASGTACLFAAILAAVVAGLRPAQFVGVLGETAKQLVKAELTLAIVLGLAMVMNYSGSTATLGLAFAATGVLFPFFSALLGWLGVFLTGSDTSANALFGTLQVVTASKLGQSPVLMAAANSAGGVMGKMISLTSIAVADGRHGDEARRRSAPLPVHA